MDQIVTERDFAEDAKILLSRLSIVAPSVVYVFNVQTQTAEYTSDSVGRMVGYSPQEVLDMGSAFMEQLCHPDDLLGFGAHMASIPSLKDGETARFDYRMRHRDGSWRWFMSSDSILERDKDGNVLRLIGAATDITEPKAAEIAAKEDQANLAALNDELHAFTHSMTHDIRAPANTIQMLLRELGMRTSVSGDPEAMELVEMGNDVLDRLLRLTEDLSVLVRTMDHAPVTSAVNTNAVVSAAMADLSAQIKETKARVTVSDLPNIWASESHIRVVFQNLIENALKYADPARSIEVRVTDATLERDAPVTICVADNGIGVPEAHQERIFNSFERGREDHQQAGSGLGLSICRRIVRAHGGDLTVESVPGAGSIFRLSLPPAVV